MERGHQDLEDSHQLRAPVELLSKQQSAWEGQETQGVPTRRGSGLKEDCKMEVEEETDCKKKLDEQNSSLQRQLRDIEKLTDMEPMFTDKQKEKWKAESKRKEKKKKSEHLSLCPPPIVKSVRRQKQHKTSAG